MAWCRGRAKVIAVNDAYRLAPWADVLYSSDTRWWEFYRGVPEFGGLKVGIQPLNPAAAWGVMVLRNTGDTGLEMHPSGLRTGRNSGAAAVNLAVHFGVSRIVLLGYDMGPAGKRTHFFGDHPARLQAQSPYESFVQLFRTMVGPLGQAGVQVVNCSRQTRLDCFPRAVLKDVLCEVAA